MLTTEIRVNNDEVYLVLKLGKEETGLNLQSFPILLAGLEQEYEKARKVQATITGSAEKAPKNGGI